MNDRDQRRYERLTRVQTFGKTNAADFPGGGTAASTFASLDALVAKFDLAKTNQIPNRVSKQTRLDALQLEFKNIARTAKAIDSREHGFLVEYRLPDSLTQAASLTHADALVGKLADNAQDTPAQLAEKAARRAKFLVYDLADDFADELRAARDALRDVQQSNQAETQGGVESTAELSVLLREGQELMLHLDATMHNKYKGMAHKLREWESASHVERDPRRAKETPAATAATPPGIATFIAA